MQFDWSVDVVAGVALVTVRLRNETGLVREARVRNELAGPVLPPRREGTFEAGWDREGVTVVVDVGDSAVRGYACPLDDADSGDPTGRIEPPATITSVDSPSDTTSPGSPDSAVNHARRSLGDPRPPRAVVEVGSEAASLDQSASADEDGTSDGDDEAGEAYVSRPDTPDEVDDRLDSVRERVAVLESLDGASVDEATEILCAHGGLSGVEALASSVEEDAEALKVDAADTESLTERIAEVSLPIDGLRRLA